MKRVFFFAILCGGMIINLISCRSSGTYDAAKNFGSITNSANERHPIWDSHERALFAGVRESITQEEFSRWMQPIISHQGLDVIVQYWVNVQLKRENLPLLPKRVEIKYSGVRFPISGVAIRSNNGKWHYSQTYGVEPTASIYNEEGVLLAECFLSSFNIFQRLRDPLRTLTIAATSNHTRLSDVLFNAFENGYEVSTVELNQATVDKVKNTLKSLEKGARIEIETSNGPIEIIALPGDYTKVTYPGGKAQILPLRQ